MELAYGLYTTSSGQRALKKLPREVRRKLLDQLQPLKMNPHLGEHLEGEFRFLRSLHMRFAGTDYRAAYEIDEREKAIIVWYAASRENFYKELRRLPLKRAA